MAASKIEQARVALVVDDDPAVLEIGLLTFEALGFRTLSAANGAEALAVLVREPVDVVFSDVVMPEMSGVELARKVKEIRPSIRVILTSGYPRDELDGLGIDAGTALIAKPYRWSDLLSAIEGS